MAEVKYYGDSNIIVTNMRIIVNGNKTYSLANVNNVSMEMIRMSSSCLLAFELTVIAIFGIFLLWLGFEEPFLLWKVFGLLSLAADIYIVHLYRIRVSYAIVMGFRFGQEKIFQSRDKGYIEKILKIINYVIANHG